MIHLFKQNPMLAAPSSRRTELYFSRRNYFSTELLLDGRVLLRGGICAFANLLVDVVENVHVVGVLQRLCSPFLALSGFMSFSAKHRPPMDPLLAYSATATFPWTHSPIAPISSRCCCNSTWTSFGPGLFGRSSGETSPSSRQFSK